MTDYEKLTVIKLRDELVARGLPKTGLKAALVQRLIEADVQSDKSDSAANEFSEGLITDESATSAVLFGPQALRQPKDDHHAEDNTAPALQTGTQDEDRLKIANVTNGDAPRHKPDESVRAPPQIEEVQEVEQHEELASDSPTVPLGYLSEPKGMRNEKSRGTTYENAREPELQLAASAKSQAGEVQPAEDGDEVSTQTALTGDETLEDSRKRKRRSQSPPPSSMKNAQKRLKTDNGRPLVELPEDSTAGRKKSEERPNDFSSRSDPIYAQESDAQTNGHTCSNGEYRLAKIHTSATVGQTYPEESSHSYIDSSALEEISPAKDGNARPSRFKSTESPMKSSPSDTRYKNLFTAPANRDPATQKPHYPESEDIIVNAALHPATSALYIRELMRPLKHENLREHLIALATPPDTAVNPCIVTEFFLDSVRTHCLVGFENISAASRVRSGLHDRVWPNERDRRQLWVDFVPEEKLKNWIDVEQIAGGSRGQSLKRWEVVYEDEENSIKAYLQEVGSSSGGLRAVQPPRLDDSQGLQAPLLSGPRISGLEPRSSLPRPDSGKGFRALDDLFTSTVAKPRLYYLPVPKAEADRRLAKLAAGRGGGRNNELRRFSFEEGVIVDNGPEFGRGGYGRGGAFAGSYRGRGRGYRGDAPRGDSWRGRRSRY